MRRLILLFLLTAPLAVLSQDTIMESRIIIQGFPPEPILMDSYSNDLALKVDTSLKPIVKIDGQSDPLTKFIQENITYPQWAVEMGIQWNIYAIFNVETSGEITDIKLLKSGDTSINHEVLRVLNLMPGFPRTDKKISYIIPFKFILKNAVMRNRRAATKDEMKGDWTCVKSDRYMMEEYFEPDLEHNNIRLSHDSIWYFDYPSQYYGSERFEVNSDWYSRINAWFQHDTLVIHDLDRRHGGFHYYLRDTFDQKIIDQLLIDTIYTPSLFRKWYVETERPDDIEYGPPIKIRYPVNVPPVFKFDEADIVEGRMIYLNINGAKRKFKILESSLDMGYIVLESFKWRKEPFFIWYFTEKRNYDVHGFRK